MQRLRQGNNRPELGGKRLSDAIEPHQHVIVQGFALVLPTPSALARMSPPRSSALARRGAWLVTNYPSRDDNFFAQEWSCVLRSWGRSADPAWTVKPGPA